MILTYNIKDERKRGIWEIPYLSIYFFFSIFYVQSPKQDAAGMRGKGGDNFATGIRVYLNLPLQRKYIGIFLNITRERTRCGAFK